MLNKNGLEDKYILKGSKKLKYGYTAGIGAGISPFFMSRFVERRKKKGSLKVIKKAILVVSFGTSHKDARQKSIEQIKKDVKSNFPNYKVYEAFTSKVIIDILWKRDREKVFTVVQAIEKIREDEIDEIIVQPTHVLNGIENDNIIKDVRKYRAEFKYIVFGAPLLNEKKDYFKVIDAFISNLPKVNKKTAIVCMGHGTDHYINASYGDLDYMFKAEGYKNIYITTVDAYPSLEDVIVKLDKYEKILLVPLMIVAGKHAKNDMAGGEGSWKATLERRGFQVKCILKGLGENPLIREIFIEHIKDAIGYLEE